ncbi:MAG: aspartate kinase [candidate division WOR-3 bacterium]|nr:aspartate kinase [candidate division WOR-3 bacterium]MCX7757205.1 aspartate kinase [candidate division WOR-3 bacterium]MDW7987931.1 aspartate kinase [candidate division WOR-3 bacterium]
MKLIVQKFGGSILKDLKSIEQVAEVVAATKDHNRVIVVVSAMSNHTDDLINMARKINPAPPPRELDMLLTIGERLTMSLLSLALTKRGYQAMSFTGSQVGIITDNEHTNAKILNIRGKRIVEALKNDIIPIVAGFQGVSINNEITTLGRGGSDITAVALAAFFKADRCELYKDVSGIFTENPKIFPKAKPIHEITYEELAEMTSSGAEIVSHRACELAIKYDVPLIIKSFSTPNRAIIIEKTMKTQNNYNYYNLEKPFVRAVTHLLNLNRLTLIAVPKLPKCLHQVIVRLAEAKIPLVFFSHGVPYNNHFDLSFIVTQENFPKALDVLKEVKKSVNAQKIDITQNLAAISLIGPGISSDPDIFNKVFCVFHKLGVHIDAFSSTEMKITCFIDQKHYKKVINALLKKFKLVKK